MKRLRRLVKKDNNKVRTGFPIDADLLPAQAGQAVLWHASRSGKSNTRDTAMHEPEQDVVTCCLKNAAGTFAIAGKQNI